MLPENMDLTLFRACGRETLRGFFDKLKKEAAALLQQPLFLITILRRYSVALAHPGEAVAAIDRTIGLGLEGDLRLAAAGSAGSREVLPGAAGRVLASVAAFLASLRLVLEAFFSIEFLLAGRENEFIAAFLARKSLVSVHVD